MSNILVKTRYFYSSMVFSSIIQHFLLHARPPQANSLKSVWAKVFNLVSLFNYKFITPTPIFFFQYESIYCYLYLSFHGQLNPPEFYIINWLPCFNIYWQEFDYFLVLAYNMFRFCNIPSPKNLNTNMCLCFL